MTTSAWLDRQEARVKAAKADYLKWVKEEAVRKGVPEFTVTFDSPYKDPACEKITKEDIEVSQTDTAIYVIARNSGEGADRYDVAGDYQLYPEELENIRMIAEAYEKAIVVLNIGGVMNLSEIKAVDGVNAGMHWQMY